MADLRLSDIAGMTGFSLRYWQRLAFNGELPGAYFIDMRGRRRQCRGLPDDAWQADD